MGYFLVSLLHSLLWSVPFLIAIPYLILRITGFPDDVFLLGAVPILAGILLSLKAFHDLATERGTTSVLKVPRKLVRKGIYSRTRNPIYVGVVLILIGESVVFKSFYLLVYTAVVFLALHLWVIHFEEPLLLRRFGREALEYFGSVPRWVSFQRIWTCWGRRRKNRSSQLSP